MDGPPSQQDTLLQLPSATATAPAPAAPSDPATTTLHQDPATESQLQESLRLIDDLKFFLATAPANWQENQIIRRYYLNHDEGFVSCVYWKNLYFITGTDIVRCMVYRFEMFGRVIIDRKKFEEGVFSDLRNLKCNQDAILENPKSEFLEFLYKNNCLRTQKKQKVFFWFSVNHDKLFADALERDLKRESSKTQQSSTTAEREPAKSFKWDESTNLYDQLVNYLNDKSKSINPTANDDFLLPNVLNEEIALEDPPSTLNVHSNTQEQSVEFNTQESEEFLPFYDPFPTQYDEPSAQFINPAAIEEEEEDLAISAQYEDPYYESYYQPPYRRPMYPMNQMRPHSLRYPQQNAVTPTSAKLKRFPITRSMQMPMKKPIMRRNPYLNPTQYGHFGRMSQGSMRSWRFQHPYKVSKPNNMGGVNQRARISAASKVSAASAAVQKSENELEVMPNNQQNKEIKTEPDTASVHSASTPQDKQQPSTRVPERSQASNVNDTNPIVPITSSNSTTNSTSNSKYYLPTPESGVDQYDTSLYTDIQAPVLPASSPKRPLDYRPIPADQATTTSSNNYGPNGNPSYASSKQNMTQPPMRRRITSSTRSRHPPIPFQQPHPNIHPSGQYLAPPQQLYQQYPDEFYEDADDFEQSYMSTQGIDPYTSAQGGPGIPNSAGPIGPGINMGMGVVPGSAGPTMYGNPYDGYEYDDGYYGYDEGYYGY